MDEIMQSIIFIILLVVYHIAMSQWYTKKILEDRESEILKDEYLIRKNNPRPLSTPDNYQLY